jgi:predicted nucleic acid-binding protein
MPNLVISNTSPLFYLHRLGQLELLHKLYGRILVPEAVAEELKAGGDQGEDVPDIADHDRSVKSLLDTLIQLDFRLSEDVVDTILRLAKE